jgi:LysM repeat protein
MKKLRKIFLPLFILALLTFIPAMVFADEVSETTSVQSTEQQTVARKKVMKKVKKQKTSKAYKKYLGKWKTVGYTLNVKVINKNYLKATITAKNGDKVTISKKMKVTKTNTLNLTSKKGKSVSVIIKFKYGKAVHDYVGDLYREGPMINISGSSEVWYEYNYYSTDKYGRNMPVMLVYSKKIK